MPYMGFKAVEASAKAGGARNPGAVAASIGRKKYGAKAFNKAAHEGHSMKGLRAAAKGDADHDND